VSRHKLGLRGNASSSLRNALPLSCSDEQIGTPGIFDPEETEREGKR